MSLHRAERFSLRGWLYQVVAWFVIAAVVVVLALAVAIPRLVGGTPYTILTGSMTPGMPPGTLVVVKPINPDDIGIGTVVTYQLTSGEPTVVTHRVVGIGYDGKGERVFTTQGDANGAPDEKPVMEVQVKGARMYSVPYLGYVSNALTSDQRQAGIAVVITMLAGYASIMFVGAARDRRSKVRGTVRDEVGA